MFELHFYEYKKSESHFSLSDEVRRDVSAFAGKPCRVYLDSHGKPLCDGAFLSVAHTDNVAVLAVSDDPIGVDIENAGRKMPDALSDFSICDWTDAEAAFKLTGLPVRNLLGSIPTLLLISRFEHGDYVISLAEKK